MPHTKLSEAEYEALPVCIQKKYFSSLERLRIAESAALHRSQRRPIYRTPSSPALRSSFYQDGLQRSPTRTRKRLQKARSVRYQRDTSQAEAEWFLSLPDKVRKRLFSREEQVLLAGRCETIIIPKFTEEVRRKVTSPLEKAPWSDILEEQGVALTVETPSAVQEEDISTSRHDVAVDFVELDDMSAPDVQQPGKRSRRSSFRRTLSLTANPFSRLSTSSAPPTSPLFPPGSRHRSASAAATPAAESLNTALDPAAIYYQDPEARAKLKQYLASPQKFDEAIEFGFPATAQQDASPTPPQLPVYDPRKVSLDVHTFLNTDMLSFLDDTEKDAARETPEADLGLYDDSSSIADEDSPATPGESGDVFDYGRRLPSSNFSSIDSVGLPPPQVKAKVADSFNQLLTGNREMTLRMTLTRPDLRANEEMLYGWQRDIQTSASNKPRDQMNPLILEDLPPESDDVTGKHGISAVDVSKQKGLMRGFLNKMKTKKTTH